MASIHLRFVPPDVENLVTLKIYEAPAQSGPFTMIEAVSAIGTYPTYINDYTTNAATSINNWFSIEWIDNKGASSTLSTAVKGNQETVVGEVVQRVMLRDASLRELVVLQEAEAVVASIFPPDPYDVPFTTPTYPQWRGMTNLTLAYCYLSQLVTQTATSGASWVAGLVSIKGESSSTGKTGILDAISALMKQASQDLGLSYSAILEMAEIAFGNGHAALPDQSRLLVEIL